MPAFDQYLHFLEAVEKLTIEQLIAELAAEVFTLPTLPGTARFDEECLDADALGRSRMALAATRFRAFGGNVIGYDPWVSAETMRTHRIDSVGLNELFARTDIVSLHCQLSEETRGFVDAQRHSRT